jgi:hypothetical protein
MRLEELTYEQLRSVVRAAASQRLIEVLDEVILADANVFLCRRSGRRFNLKYDVDFGSALEPVDRHTAAELGEIAKILMDALPRGV